MKQILILFISITTFAQSKLDKEIAIILEEGKLLYNSEIASWYGTDIFLEVYKEREKIGGYFSYTDSNNLSKCIFFSKEDKPKVIGAINFESTIKLETAKADLKVREFTKNELELYKLRKEALTIIYSDTIFKTYSNTNFNVIPIINKNQKKVFVLTGPKINNIVILGNDYLLNFDKNNKLLNRRALHKNIIPIQIDEDKELEATMHNHLHETGDLITSTDICTLMLYGKIYNMKQHFVISEKYVSIWNCETDTFECYDNRSIRENGKVEYKNKKLQIISELFIYAK